MSFLSPWSWLWFAPLGGIIIFLYLLKLKRVPRLVSSVMLWNRLVADLQANAPFQKLRRNLLLYLQLLAALVLVAALSRPFLRVKGLEGQSIALILDTSASMRATDLAGTRFEAAKKIALKAVDDLGRGDTMAVIAAAAKTQVVSPFTSDRRALGARINSLQCTDTTTRLEEAVRLADSLCARKKHAQIVVLSDGALPPLAEPLASRARLSFTRVGRRGENVAITALGARRSLSEGGYELLVALENLCSTRRVFTVEVSREGRLLDAREQSLSAGGRGAEVFQIPAAEAGLVRAKLEIADDLATDNAAWAFLAPRRQASVLLVTKGDLFLERALALDASLVVTKAQAPPSKAPPYQLVVNEGSDGAALPRARGYLFINSGGAQAPVEITGEVSAPTITDWSRSDPVTRYLDLSGVQIAKARRASLKPWGRALAESEGGPVIAAGERGGIRSIYLGWDLLQSDFPLRVAFPIFIANCVDWLVPSEAGGQGAAVRAGEVVPLPVPAGLSRLRLVSPDGSSTDLTVDQSPLPIKDTDRAGVYTVEGQGFRQQFAVNLLSREESNTKPADQITIAGKPVTGSLAGVMANKEMWRWPVIIALCLITLEWIVFHRRP